MVVKHDILALITDEKICHHLQIQILKGFSFVESYHLLELLTITPLSMEKLSVGRPAIFQALILIGSPSVLLREKSSEDGIFFD